MSVVTDPIGDFLTRIRNGCQAKKDAIVVPHSKIKFEIARILQEEGYIWSYELDTEEKYPRIVIKNKFVNQTPAITGIKRVSKPGLRRYVGSSEIPRVLGGLGVAILSTSKGIVSDGQARRERLGGEIIAYVW